MRPIDDLFAALARSAFRSRFRLDASDRAYLQTKGLETVMSHAADFAAKRLAPAMPPNDGRQTPMRGHPVFVAQHATATCCRGCLDTWHRISTGRELRPEEIAHVLAVIERWLQQQSSTPASR